MMATIPKGIRWTSAGTLVAQGSGLIRLVLVSTAVSIQDLGFYAIAASLAASAGFLGDSGLRQLYLSRQADSVGADPQSLTGSVWLGIVGIQGLATVAAAPLGLAYLVFMQQGDPMVVSMAIAISGCGVLSALQNPMTLSCERGGDFGPSIKSESIGQVAGLAVVCVTIAAWPSAWLLVIGQGTAALVSSIATYVLLGIPRDLRIRLGTLLPLFRQGRPFMWISATTYVTASLDKLLIGLLLSPTATGVFFLAQKFADAPRQLHSSVLGRTMLPHYAQALAEGGLRSLDTEVRRFAGFTAGLFAIAFTGLAAGTGLHAAGWLGSKWEAISGVLVVLLVGTALRAACHVLAPALVVTGRVQVETRLKFVESALYLLLLPAFIFMFGLPGAAMAFACIYAFSLVRRLRAVARVTTRMATDGSP